MWFSNPNLIYKLIFMIDRVIYLVEYALSAHITKIKDKRSPQVNVCRGDLHSVCVCVWMGGLPRPWCRPQR